jgi:hypothetical protein
MQADQQPATASLNNQAFSLMTRLHVILRRQNQRITDIEYMQVSPAYCRHVLALATQSPLPDLQEIGAKLEEFYFGQDGLFVRPSERPALVIKDAGISDATSPTSANPSLPIKKTSFVEPPDAAYVGRLR